MKIVIDQKERGTNFLSKVTGVLFGIFSTSVIFAITIKLLEVKGLYLGLVVSILIVIFGFYYTKRKTTIRMIIWGMTGTVLIGTITFILALMSINSLLEGF